MLPTLWFGNASSIPTELKIREGEQVLGRAADADLCLSETFVSTHHARLNWQHGQLKVLDLSSTNGTLVNGVPVVGWTTLADGDVIEFGGVEAVVRLPADINLTDPAERFPPPPFHQPDISGEIPTLRQADITGEIPPLTTPPKPRPSPGDTPTERLKASTMPSIAGDIPDDVPPETVPPTTPPTGITITDIEAVTEGYGELSREMFDIESGYSGPFGTHPDSAYGPEQPGRQTYDSAPAGRYRRPQPTVGGYGISPIVIIVAVAVLVVVVLAAVFLS